MISAGIYLHIPFCVKKCPYCDFYSLPYSEPLKDRYVAALLRDINSVEGRPAADSVYFGGGTPSLLDPADFSAILSAISEKFTLSPESEITAELNPGDASPGFLSAVRAAGINRLSVGVQSLCDDRLRLLGRRHTADQARHTIAAAFAAGFNNISADIMIALPGQTADDAAADADGILALGVQHLSAYILNTEHSGVFWKQPLSLPGDDEAADIYLAVCGRARERGLCHYEISNFCQPGFESRHNLKYWRCQDYYAFGAAAAGCLSGRRYRYPSDTEKYIEGCPPVFDGEVTAADYIICTLRTSAGLDTEILESDFGADLKAREALIDGYIAAGYMSRRGSVLSLTERGFLVSNSILSHLI